MPRLTAQQRQILSLIETEARRRGLPAHGRRIKSAIETGLVESNLRNLPGGDADSAGWRQERASLYPDPTNTRASVKRYFDEAGKLDTGHGSAGQLAARVQRPAAQYRGRYDKASPIANALMKNQQGLPMQRGARAATSVPDGRGQLIANYVMSNSKNAANDLATGIAGLQQAPVRNLSSAATPSGSGPSATGSGKLLELFWQGANGIDVKNGQKVPQGFVSGHTDHVHVAAGPKEVVRLGKLAQSMGLNVGENPAFGTVHRVHAQNSWHYKNQAIDVSGDPQKMAAFAHKVAGMFGVR